MRQQFSLRLAFDEEADARRASRSLALKLIEDLTERGYGDFQAPLRPLDGRIIWDVFAHCRILIVYVTPEAYSSDADKFALRVDVLARPLEVVHAQVH